MMRRRMAQMNARMNPGGMGASSQPSGKGVPGGMPHHPTMVQGGGGMPNHANAAAGKPGSSAHPNQNVLEAVKKVVLQSLHYLLEVVHISQSVYCHQTKKHSIGRCLIDSFHRCRRRLRTSL